MEKNLPAPPDRPQYQPIHVVVPSPPLPDIPPKDISVQLEETVCFIKSNLPADRLPKLAIVCGSGLGGLVDTLDDAPGMIEFKYENIPNFSVSTGTSDMKSADAGTQGCSISI